MARRPDWMSLPSELLERISKHLTFDPDYLRFRFVCTSWRSAAPKRPHLPWLIGHRQDDNGHNTIFTFFTLSPTSITTTTTNNNNNNNNMMMMMMKILPIPDLPESSSFLGGLPCIGSSYGWMALLDSESRSIILYNPLTTSQIHLPTLPHSLDFERYTSSDFVHLLGKTITRMFSSKEIENNLPSQINLSSDPALSSDYLVLATSSCRQKMAFFRAGDDTWTVMQIPGSICRIHGAVYYKGRFYFVAYNAVYACCIVGQNWGVRKVCELKEYLYEAHLVESKGDLLVVACPILHSHSHWKDYGFSVYKLYWRDHSDSEQQQVELVKVDDLGDRALFLGRNQSFSVSVSQFPRWVANTIYYHETVYQLARDEEEHFVVYNLTNRRYIPIPKDEANPQRDWKPCVWFSPNLLPGNLGTS